MTYNVSAITRYHTEINKYPSTPTSSNSSLTDLLINKIKQLASRLFSSSPSTTSPKEEKYEIALTTLKESVSKEDSQSLKALPTSTNPEDLKYRASLSSALDILQSREGTPRLRYQTFHKYLREAIESPSFANDTTIAKEILLNLCEAKFTKNSMFNYHNRTLPRVPAPDSRSTPYATFASSLPVFNKQLAGSTDRKSFPALCKQKLEGNEIFPRILDADNMGKSNVPEVRSVHTYENGKTVTSLRHGTAALSLGGRAMIAPEYRGFLEAKKKEAKKVFYVNHQRQSSSQCSKHSLDKSEIARSHLLHDLEEDYPDTFYCLSLPMDGPVFTTNSFTQAETFKQNLCENVTSQTGGFKLPREIDPKSLKIEDICEFVHSSYFEGSVVFDKESQQEFAMIVYFYIKERIKHLLKVDFIVTACKDNKDRGNASATIDEMLLHYHTQDKNLPSFLSALKIRFFGAFMIKREEIIDKRVQLVVRVAKRLEKLNRQTLQNNFRWKFLSSGEGSFARPEAVDLLSQPSHVPVGSKSPFVEAPAYVG